MTLHLRDEHQLEIEIEETQFDNEESFLKWKENIERTTMSEFVLNCAPKKKLDKIVSYYYCNRAGEYRAKGSGKRQLKTQGSAKINSQCSAHIKATEDLNTKCVHISYCSTHYNHDNKLAFLTIPLAIRQSIALKLDSGVSIEKILDDIRDKIDGKLNRQHLLNRQDVRNIKYQYNIECIQKHSNDLMSVAAWVEEIKICDHTSVLVFKVQGMEQADDLNNLSDQDFILCLQTPFQRDMLNKFGGDIICIDSTHGTNMYDFFLVTILVIDEYGEGLPVAWMISNREDAMALNVFFTTIKNACGMVTPKWFMSDCAEQYYNAWQGVFDTTETTKVICIWHVHRAWRKSLREHIEIKEEQIHTYHMLCTLLQERSEAQFRKLLQEFMTYIYTKHYTFYTYFFTNYCKIIHQWASCYRINCTANTNTFLESFHSVLKVVYLQKKQNRRVDNLLSTLLKIARDKIFERLRKLELGKNTHRICEINKRHKSALSLSPTSIETIADNQWIVKSETKNMYYTIANVQETCECQIKCHECNICPHIYSCTCLDATLHATVCKHIHLIYMYICMSPGEKLTTYIPSNTIPNNEVDYTYFNEVLTHNKIDPNLDSIKTTFLSRLAELEQFVRSCHNQEAILAASKHLKAGISIFQAFQNQNEDRSLMKKRQYAPNQNMDKQLKFFSTKKKRTNATPILTKPSLSQTTACKENLGNTESMFCGRCFKENDINHANQTVEWIQCDKCMIWLHEACAESNQLIKDKYICNFCLSV